MVHGGHSVVSGEAIQRASSGKISCRTCSRYRILAANNQYSAGKTEPGDGSVWSCNQLGSDQRCSGDKGISWAAQGRPEGARPGRGGSVSGSSPHHCRDDTTLHWGRHCCQDEATLPGRCHAARSRQGRGPCARCLRLLRWRSSAGKKGTEAKRPRCPHPQQQRTPLGVKRLRELSWQASATREPANPRPAIGGHAMVGRAPQWAALGLSTPIDAGAQRQDSMHATRRPPVNAFFTS